jgi:hypothetical protein
MILISVVAYGVGVANKVEPVDCEALSKVRRFEETLDFGLDCDLGITFKGSKEAFSIGGCGRKAC